MLCSLAFLLSLLFSTPFIDTYSLDNANFLTPVQVTFVNQDKMNLIGFFLRDLLQSNLDDPARQRAAKKLDGRFIFNASGMAVTIAFGKGMVQIEPGAVEKGVAQIKGEMSDLLDVALGASYIKYLLTGRIAIRGNLFKLLKLITILRK